MTETASGARDDVKIFVVGDAADKAATEAVFDRALEEAMLQIANVIDEEGARLAIMDTPNALKE